MFFTSFYKNKIENLFNWISSLQECVSKNQVRINKLEIKTDYHDDNLCDVSDLLNSSKKEIEDLRKSIYLINQSIESHKKYIQEQFDDLDKQIHDVVEQNGDVSKKLADVVETFKFASESLLEKPTNVRFSWKMRKAHECKDADENSVDDLDELLHLDMGVADGNYRNDGKQPHG